MFGPGFAIRPLCGRRLRRFVIPSLHACLYYTINRLSRTHQLSDATHRRLYLHRVVVQPLDPLLVLNEFTFQGFDLPADGIHRLLVLPLRFIAPVDVALHGIGRSKGRTPDKYKDIEYSTRHGRFRQERSASLLPVA